MSVDQHGSFYSKNATMLKCVTSQNVGNDNLVDVEVSFGGLRKYVPEQFEYVSDPAISMVEPKTTILR